MTTPSGAMPPDLPDRPPLPQDQPTQGPPRRTGSIVLAVLLGIALVGLIVLVVFVLQLRGALADLQLELDRTSEELRELERDFVEQREQLDEKESFGQSMRELMSSAERFNGVAIGSLVDFDEFERLAQAAWVERHEPASVRAHRTEVESLTASLDELLATAASRADNSSGTRAEAIIDAAGHGFVETVWGDAAAICQSEALGCVWSGEPTTIYLDAAEFDEPYRTEWGEVLVAHHEFAHVLQLTNPRPTEEALVAFDGDSEMMADCYALTMLDSWTLSERVWIDSFSYWDVAYGYGHVCGDEQRRVIREWIDQVGVQYRAVTQ